MSINISTEEFAELVAQKVAEVLKSSTAASSSVSVPKASKKAKDPSAPKRPLSEGTKAWNAQVSSVLEDMKANGWEEFSDVKGTVFPAGVQNAEGAWVFPDTQKPPTPARGGFARASYLKTKDDPEALEKAKERAQKRSEKVLETASNRSVSSGASVTEEPEKKKRVWSEDAKKKAAEKRAAKKAEAKPAEAGGAAAEAPAEEDGFEDAEEAPKPAAKPLALKKKEVAKKVDLSFYAWTHEGEDYYKNDRGDIISQEMTWVGRFDGSKIDESVEEPEDLENAQMRE